MLTISDWFQSARHVIMEKSHKRGGQEVHHSALIAPYVPSRLKYLVCRDQGTISSGQAEVWGQGRRTIINYANLT